MTLEDALRLCEVDHVFDHQSNGFVAVKSSDLDYVLLKYKDHYTLYSYKLSQGVSKLSISRATLEELMAIEPLDTSDWEPYY